MKLWDKGKGSATDLVHAFTSGNDRVLDMRLAKYDIQGSMAHARMLAAIGIIEDKECEAMLKVLEELLQACEKDEFQIEEEYEDVHSKVEAVLIERLGETGKKIHTARSRNDQVLVDLHLYFKHELSTSIALIEKLFNTLIQLSEQHKNAFMPGYTHMQVAMPSSFGLWFGAFAESLVDDVASLQNARRYADQNPLGSAAGYGSSFPIDREFTTKALEFSTMRYNVVSAQMSRGKLEYTVSQSLTSTALTLNKLASDICLYMGQNFGFFTFPDELTTGSSIMPHKKNPDVWELIRARTNQLLALPAEISALLSNLPVGYHRDLQQVKERIFPAVDMFNECLKMTDYMLQHIQVNQQAVDSNMYDYMYTVEEVNALVNQGMSFREAYKKVGEQVEKGQFRANRSVSHTHAGSIGNLCTDKIIAKMKAVLRA